MVPSGYTFCIQFTLDPSRKSLLPLTLHVIVTMVQSVTFGMKLNVVTIMYVARWYMEQLLYGVVLVMIRSVRRLVPCCVKRVIP